MSRASAPTARAYWLHNMRRACASCPYLARAVVEHSERVGVAMPVQLRAYLRRVLNDERVVQCVELILEPHVLGVALECCHIKA